MQNPHPNKQRTLGRWKMFAILAVCASPLVASYLSYYVIKPSGRTNYGEILDPRQYPLPVLNTVTLDGTPTELTAYQDKWIMLQADTSECDAACKTKLYEMRQLRTAQGKEMNRIERVWLITDNKPLESSLMREYDGTHMLRAQPALVEKWLPAASGGAVTDHIYLIDPRGHLMMRFPKNAEPKKIMKDLSKLLRASSIG